MLEKLKMKIVIKREDKINKHSKEKLTDFIKGIDTCVYCGDEIFSNVKGGRQKYCGNECENKWISERPLKYNHKCDYCGKNYTSMKKQNKFCSIECSTRNRVYRDEDVEDIKTKLLSNQKIGHVPKWIKELLK